MKLKEYHIKVLYLNFVLDNIYIYIYKSETLIVVVEEKELLVQLIHDVLLEFFLL